MNLYFANVALNNRGIKVYFNEKCESLNVELSSRLIP